MNGYPQFKTNCLRTWKGHYISFDDPCGNEYDIEDIAHALGQIPRFGGHLNSFYSVAQHCVVGSYLIEAKYAFEFLMHDATEAYLLDIPKPLKKQLPDYQRMERLFYNALAKTFGLPTPLPDAVKKVDEIMLHTEWATLIKDNDGINIPPWDHGYAKSRFLSRYHELKTHKTIE